MSRKTTLKQVAEKVGVSVPTISTVLNAAGGNTMVSAKTRERILSAARQLGYQPNYHAQSLKRGRSNAIGLLLDSPQTHEAGEAFLRELARGAEIRARERGYDFVVMGPRPNDPVLHRGTARAEQGGVDALIAPGGKPSLREFDSRHLRVPFVLLWDDRYGTGLPFVEVDETPGIEAAVEHLHRLEHRRLLWLSPAGAGAEERERFSVLRAAARRLNLGLGELQVPAILPAERNLAGAVGHYRRAAQELLRRLRAETAIVCFNEILALGAMQALWEAGDRVPGHVSIVGFDDLHGRLGHPPLSVVSLCLAEIGARAVDRAIEMIENPSSILRLRGQSNRVPARFIARESTGPARQQ